MAPPKTPQQPPAADDWMPEGVLGADSDAAWMPEGTEGAEAAPAEPAPAPPAVGPGETFLNRTVNALPFGHPIVDAAGAAQLKASTALGRVLPRALAAKLPGVIPESNVRIPLQGQAALEQMGSPVEQPTEPSLTDAYRQVRDTRNARTDAGSEQNPWTGRAGTAAGILLSAAGPFPSVKAAPGAGLLSRMAAGAATGAGYGAVTGLTEGDHDLTRGQWEEAGKNTAFGSLLGAGIGGALPAAVSLARAIYRGVVTPTPAAKLLREKGVPLTTGQMNPDSALAQVEEASTSVGGFGTQIKAQREAAATGWQDAVLNEARPPGMPKLDASKPIDARLDAAYKGFDDAYAPARGLRIAPKTADGVPLVPPAPTPPPPGGPPQPTAALPGAPLRAGGRPRDPVTGRFLKGGVAPPAPPQMPLPGVPGAAPPPAAAPAPTAAPPPVPVPPPPQAAFDKAVSDPSILATANERGVVRKFLNNELTLIANEAQGGSVSSDALLKMRHNIRQAASKALKEEKFPMAEMLERAEEQVTSAIEAALPDDAVKALRAADVAWSKYKPVEAAVAKSGDRPGGFTPVNLSEAIRSDSGRSAYARGGGGVLRDLASAGREVMDSRVPVTGARLLVSGPVGQWVTAPMSYAANLPGPQRFLLGETAPQRAVQTVEEALAQYLRRNPVEAEVRALLPANQQPAYANEEAEMTKARADAIRRR